MASKTWDKGTRWLHWGLSVPVTFQLVVSLFMEAPQPGLKPQPFGRLGFQSHEAVGLLTIAVVLAHWVWSASRERGEGIRHLFPWGRSDRASVLADLRGLRAGVLPEGGPRGGLAGLVHGLGFLAVTGMAVLGGGLFLLLQGDGGQTPLFRNLADLHAGLANLVWLYWLGHVAMVVVHETRGHRILAGVFRL